MKLFKGTFNWYCELHVLYTHAKNKDKATSNFIVQLSRLLKVSRRSVYMYFLRESVVNFKVKEVSKNAKEN